uniref:Protein-tyrosine-phosphatase n=1 Tax=Arcella intermedia TaxID=1963864 RepID=A0A6B2LAX8_9EUKA
MSKIEGSDNSDYINANWIYGYDGSPKKYIATQGPNTDTFNDFWKMIWENQVHVVVMLTREVEGGDLKCDKYWTDTEKSFGDVSVVMVKSKKRTQDIIKNKFKIVNKQLSENNERHLIQYQFVGWPDHGTPSSTESFLLLMELVEATAFKYGGPICVHCSAGVGRTGTFFTIHIIIEVIREYFEKMKTKLRSGANLNISDLPAINVVNTILALRTQRMGMVQTKDQLEFCYQVILSEYNKLWKELFPRKASLPKGQ